MKTPPKPARRHFHRQPTHGLIHVSHGIAHALASGYFKLINGNASQRAAAEEYKAMVLSMGGGS